jgi:hypothetical protein
MRYEGLEGLSADSMGVIWHPIYGILDEYPKFRITVAVESGPV